MAVYGKPTQPRGQEMRKQQKQGLGGKDEAKQLEHCHLRECVTHCRGLYLASLSG
jgi:hypothetical protein